MSSASGSPQHATAEANEPSAPLPQTSAESNDANANDKNGTVIGGGEHPHANAAAVANNYAAKKSLKQQQRQERRAQEVREREEKDKASAQGPMVLTHQTANAIARDQQRRQKETETGASSATTVSALPPLPPIVFGTHMLQHEEAEKAVFDALAAGYRGVDTASRYFNEEQVSAAIARSGVPREELFLITKIGPQDTKKGREAILKSFFESLRKLKTDYLDLYLMHWPGVGGIAPEDPKAVPKRIEAWRAMAELKARGYVRYIGVSNYKLRHFESFEKANAESNNGTAAVPLPLPDVHQTELHPLCKQHESSAYCMARGIKLQQYSPLAKTDSRLFEHPSMVEAVSRMSKLLASSSSPSSASPSAAAAAIGSVEVTPSLMCLLWGRYKGYSSAAVRSTNPLRIAANLAAPVVYDTLVAPYADRVSVLAELDAALANEEDIHTCWESSKVY